VSPEDQIEYYFGRSVPLCVLIWHARESAKRLSERVAKRRQLDLFAPELTFAEREALVEGCVLLQ
jgi:hypothetical protein